MCSSEGREEDPYLLGILCGPGADSQYVTSSAVMTSAVLISDSPCPSGKTLSKYFIVITVKLLPLLIMRQALLNVLSVS